MAVRVYRDSKGRTRYAVEFQQAGSRVLRRLYPGATRGDALALEIKLRGEIFQVGTLGNAPEITLEEAILRWLRDRAIHLKDGRKAAQNAALLAPFVAGKLLREAPEAARQAVACWYVGASSRGRAATPSGLAPSTINRRLCVLKAAAKYAWKQGWIADNVSGRISLLPESGKREVYLTAMQVRVLASRAPTTTCRAAIMIAAYSGLRVAELLALTSITSRAASLSVPTSKTGKPRYVPIVGLLRPYLSALPLGLSYDQLRREFLVARKAAGMEHVRWHDLRHTTASLLINAGVDLYTVGAILGHSSTITTSRYAHLAQATLRKAMGKLK